MILFSSLAFPHLEQQTLQLELEKIRSFDKLKIKNISELNLSDVLKWAELE